MADGHSNNTSSGSNVPSTTGAPASICLDVFHKFHERLCNITDVDYVVSMSDNKSIIIMFQHLEINRISSGLEKMKKLLENVALPLENHRTDQFYKLLDILGESGIESTKSLANSMRREISNYLLHLSEDDIICTPPCEALSGNDDSQIIVCTRPRCEPYQIADDFNAIKNFKYQSLPRKLPQPYILRMQLLKNAVRYLCSVKNNPQECCTTLTLTGAGGFGKTTLALALCHHSEVCDKFTNGFLFIQLGPNVTNSTSILNEQYCLMTNRNLKYGPYNDVEARIKNLTRVYNDILVIIDDVWDTDDAIPIVKAFVNCSIILTTRLTDIRIPTTNTICVGSMTETEAVDVLTKDITGCSGMIQDDVNLLKVLAEYAFKWPLLLSLLRGQIYHYLTRVKLPCHKAFQKVYSKLIENGLTAFDQNDIEQSNKNRQISVQACIQISLEFLTESSLNKFRSLILYTGIGGSSMKSILHCLWAASEQEAKQCIQELVECGLICTHTKMIPPHYTNAESFVEVHAVISQVCISSLKSQEVVDLSPFLSPLCKEKLVSEEAAHIFKYSYKVKDLNSLSPLEYLTYNKEKLEHVILPYYMNDINMHALHDPHLVTMMLKKIQTILVNSVEVLAKFNIKINDLLMGCEKAVRNAHMLSRKCNKQFQECLCARNFDSLIPTINEYYKTEFIKSLANDCVTTVRDIAMQCDIVLQIDLLEKCKYLQNLTHEYHPVTIEKLPRLKLYTVLHKDITTCLAGHSSAASDTIRVYNYISSGEFNENVQLVHRSYITKISEIDPQFASDHNPD